MRFEFSTIERRTSSSWQSCWLFADCLTVEVGRVVAGLVARFEGCVESLTDACMIAFLCQYGDGLPSIVKHLLIGVVLQDRQAGTYEFGLRPRVHLGGVVDDEHDLPRTAGHSELLLSLGKAGDDVAPPQQRVGTDDDRDAHGKSPRGDGRSVRR